MADDLKPPIPATSPPGLREAGMKERPDEEEHGTYAALQAHRARKEKPCTPCKRAAAVYMKAYRKRGRCAPGLGWPLQSAPDRD